LSQQNFLTQHEKHPPFLSECPDNHRSRAKRIVCSANRAQLQTTAFVNTDGTIAVVVMNAGNTKMNYRLYVGDVAVESVSLPHSIATVVF
jgi:glucosylceramidase